MDIIIIDTETNGLRRPILPLEIAAQRYNERGRIGEPFKKVINHGCDIDPKASRVNGFTREIIERDGEEPTSVYKQFVEYANWSPICSYNLRFDLGDVLMPELDKQQLEVTEGFCFYKMAQRTFENFDLSNLKLQTLRQYFYLPERGAHTALGDVETVIDLYEKQMKVYFEIKGINNFEKIMEYLGQEWYSRKIPFGKFKGRFFDEALQDKDMQEYLEWLAINESDDFRKMGVWYLSELAKTIADPIQVESPPPSGVIENNVGDKLQKENNSTNESDEAILKKIGKNRLRLSEIEADLFIIRKNISDIEVKIFTALSGVKKKIKDYSNIIYYRELFIKSLLRETYLGEEEIESNYKDEKKLNDEEYAEQINSLNGYKEISKEDRNEIKLLYRKLANFYHPDKHQDKDDIGYYEALTIEINRAKESGDLDALREICKSPEDYLATKGISWKNDIDIILDFYAMNEMLENEILKGIEEINNSKNSESYNIYKMGVASDRFLDELIASQQKKYEDQLNEAIKISNDLYNKIAEITGEPPKI